jgi:hypothetical protein
MSKMEEELNNHINSLKVKHRNLDEQVLELEKQTFGDDHEIRRLKTMKLWYKDEIYRLEKKLTLMNNG